MSSRKRQSDTTIITSGDRDMISEAKPTANKSRLKIRIKRFHGVARWTWNAGSDDEVCGICQSAFEGVAPGIKYPGDECPVVFGKCGHAFHLQVRGRIIQFNSNFHHGLRPNREFVSFFSITVRCHMVEFVATNLSDLSVRDCSARQLVVPLQYSEESFQLIGTELVFCFLSNFLFLAAAIGNMGRRRISSDVRTIIDDLCW